MFKVIDLFLSGASTSPIYLTKTGVYLRQLKMRLNLAQDRAHDTTPIPSKLSRMLEQILTNAEIKDKVLAGENLPSIQFHLTVIREALERQFDPIYRLSTSRLSRGIVYSGAYDYELGLPMENTDVVAAYVLGDTSIEYRPLRVLRNDATELSFDVQRGLLNYGTGYPSIVILGIDVVLLGTMYADQLIQDETTDIETFLDKLIKEALLKDSADQWMLYQYATLFKTLGDGRDDRHADDASDQYGRFSFSHLGAPYESAIQEIVKAIDNSASSSQRASRILASLPCIYRDDIWGIYRDLKENLFMFSDYRYHWIYLLVYQPYIDILVNLLKLRKGDVTLKSTARVMQREVDILIKNRPWSRLSFDAYLALQIQTRFDRLLEDLTDVSK